MSGWLTGETIDLLARGVGYTVMLTAITSVLSLAIGILMGTFRLSSSEPLRTLGTVYVEIHRNIPALVLIIFWAFAVPNLFPPEARAAIFFNNPLMEGLSDLTGLPLAYYGLAVILALTLNTSAYLAELFRAGVGTIASEHTEAARSLGASAGVVYWKIVLPQGVRAAFPAISTRLIHNMKNTSLAAFVSVPELFQGTQTAITRTFRAVELLLLAAVIYLTLSVLFSALLRWIEQGLDRRPKRAASTQGAGVAHG